MTCTLSECPELPTPYPATLAGLGDNTGLPSIDASQFFPTGVVSQDQINQLASDISSRYTIVNDPSIPTTNQANISGDVQSFVISNVGIGKALFNRSELSDGFKSLTSWLSGQGYRILPGGGSSSGGNTSASPSAPSVASSAPGLVSSFVAPFTSMFATKPTYQSSGFRASGLRVASSFSLKSRNSLVLLAAVGGILMIGVVLINSAD